MTERTIINHPVSPKPHLNEMQALVTERDDYRKVLESIRYAADTPADIAITIAYTLRRWS